MRAVRTSITNELRFALYPFLFYPFSLNQDHPPFFFEAYLISLDETFRVFYRWRFLKLLSNLNKADMPQIAEA